VVRELSELGDRSRLDPDASASTSSPRSKPSSAARVRASGLQGGQVLPLSPCGFGPFAHGVRLSAPLREGGDRGSAAACSRRCPALPCGRIPGIAVAVVAVISERLLEQGGRVARSCRRRRCTDSRPAPRAHLGDGLRDRAAPVASRLAMPRRHRPRLARSGAADGAGEQLFDRVEIPLRLPRAVPPSSRGVVDASRRRSSRAPARRRRVL
jgi:hypothetical protein